MLKSQTGSVEVSLCSGLILLRHPSSTSLGQPGCLFRQVSARALGLPENPSLLGFLHKQEYGQQSSSSNAVKVKSERPCGGKLSSFKLPAS